MAWARLDDNYIWNQKIMNVDNHGLALHVASIVYSAKNRTDGFISQEEARRLCAMRDVPRQTVERLCMLRLWEPTDGGYLIHDFLVYNPSRTQLEERDAEIEKRKQEGRRRGFQNAGRDARGRFAPRESSAPLATASSGENTTASRSATRTASDRYPVPVPVPVPIDRSMPEDPGIKGHDRPQAVERSPASPSPDGQPLDSRQPMTANANTSSPEFQEFMANYPKKVRVVAAWHAWQETVRQGASPKDLIASARHFARHMAEQGQEERYIPLAKTFLGPERLWEEYVQGVPKASLPPPKRKPSARAVDRSDYAGDLDEYAELARRKAEEGNRGPTE